MLINIGGRSIDIPDEIYNSTLQKFKNGQLSVGDAAGEMWQAAANTPEGQRTNFGEKAPFEIVRYTLEDTLKGLPNLNQGPTNGGANDKPAAPSEPIKNSPTPSSSPITSGYVAIPSQSVAGQKSYTGPTGSLQPGQTGPSVKALQQYLVSQGYLTQEQMDTGPGIYGPQTTAAVKTMQEKLGVDNSSGPGYFGPKTISALQSQAGASSPAGTSYFQYTANGLVPVTDNTTLNALKKGDITASTYNSFSEVPTTSTRDTPHPDETALTNSADFQELSSSQQDVIKSIMDVVQTNDASKADLLKRAFERASKDADPIFRQELKIAIDAMQRGFVAEEDDASFKEKQLTDRLTDLKTDVDYAKGKLSLDEELQLTQLQSKYENDLENTRTDLASKGFTVSSRRAKAEEILSTTKGQMVESTQREFAAKVNDLNNTSTRTERDTTDQLAYLAKVTAANKTDLGRKTEAIVGSKNLPGTPGYNPLGDLVGTSERAKQSDIDRAVQDYYSMGLVP